MTPKKNPWFRMYSDFMFDEKIEFLAFEDQRHYVFILCMKNSGLIDKDYTQPGMLDRVVSKRLGLYGEAFEAAKKRLIESGLIDYKFQPVAWDKRQFVSDSSVERTKTYRERMKRHGDVTVTAQEADTDTDTEKEGEKKPSAYAPPLPADLLKDFLAVRKAKMAGPLTKTAMAGIAREAEKASVSLIDAVTACCEFGWQGFNAQWYADRTTAKPAATTANRYPDKNAIPPVSAIWHESAAGVAAKAVELGIAAQDGTESHPAFKRRVLSAVDRPAPGINELAAMAARRGA